MAKRPIYPLFFLLLLAIRQSSCCNPGCLRCNHARNECIWCDQHHYYSTLYKDCVKICVVSIAHTSTHGGVSECLDIHHEVFTFSTASVVIIVLTIGGFLGFCGLLYCIAKLKNKRRSKVFHDPSKRIRNELHSTVSGIPTDACCQDLEREDAVPTNTKRGSENRSTRASEEWSADSKEW